MLPSSGSSQLPSNGAIDPYKRFNWLMQTQIEKLADQSATTLSLGNIGSHGHIASSTMKETKPWNSSCRADIVSAHANRVLAMAAEAPASLSNCFPITDNAAMVNGAPTSSLSRGIRYDSNTLGSNPGISSQRWPATISPYYELASERKEDHGVKMFPQRIEQLSLSIAQSLSPSIAECESNVVSRADCMQGVRRRAGRECTYANEHASGDRDFRRTCDEKDSIVLLRAVDEAGQGAGLRMCTLCGTSKTPLWRSGPKGPKSLCNACGIRMKKSRRRELDVSSAACIDAGGAGEVVGPMSNRLKQCAASSSIMGAGRGGGIGTHALKRKLSMEASEPTKERKKKRGVARIWMSWAAPSSVAANSGTGGKYNEGGAKLGATAKRGAKMGSCDKIDELEEAAVLLMALSRGLTLS